MTNSGYDMMLAALKDTEWVEMFDPHNETIEWMCPWCRWGKVDGHGPDCLRQAAIAACGERIVDEATLQTGGSRA